MLPEFIILCVRGQVSTSAGNFFQKVSGLNRFESNTDFGITIDMGCMNLATIITLYIYMYVGTCNLKLMYLERRILARGGKPMDNGHTQVLEVNCSPPGSSCNGNVAFVNCGATTGGDNPGIAVNLKSPIFPADVHSSFIQCTDSTVVQCICKEIHSDSKVNSSIT